jgi:hypothetical protein
LRFGQGDELQEDARLHHYDHLLPKIN